VAESLTPDDVANLITLVAPGFFAYSAYTYRYPQRARDEIPTLVVSVALSLPLVALGTRITELWNDDPTATDLDYAGVLILLGLGSGWLAGLLRDGPRGQRLLGRFGVARAPDATVLGRVIRKLPSPTLVTVTSKDGTSLSGSPRWATDDPEAEHRELFVTHAVWWDEQRSDWPERPREGGILVNLEEVQAIEVLHTPG
jgi:hypothetical protein